MDKKKEHVYLQQVQVALEVLHSLSNLQTPANTHTKLLKHTNTTHLMGRGDTEMYYLY